jgi:hypothetical protein
MQTELRSVKGLTLMEGTVSDLLLGPVSTTTSSVGQIAAIDGIVLGKSVVFPLLIYRKRRSNKSRACDNHDGHVFGR